jgi:hypothetical protein
LNLVGQALPGVAGALLRDPKVSSNIINNPTLHAGAQALAEGRIEEGLKTLLSPEAGRDDAAAVVAQDKPTMARLAPLGINSAADLSQVGGAILDAFKVGDDIKSGNGSHAVGDLAGAVRDLPKATQQKMIDTVIGHLPPGLQQTARAVAPLLVDAQVDHQLGQAFEAVKNRDPAGAMGSLARVGEAVSTNEPQSAVAFLDSLGHLPGNAGTLFKSHPLNQQIVASGALNDVFGSVEKLSQGDGGGAIDKLGDAGGHLLTSGRKISIAGQDLPISQEGAQAMLELTGRIIALCPPEIRDQVLAQAGVAGSAVPLIGPAINTAIDGVQVINDVNEGKQDLDSLADAGQLLMDLGTFFPTLQPFAATGKMMIATARTVNDAVIDAKDLKQTFFGN